MVSETEWLQRRQGDHQIHTLLQPWNPRRHRIVIGINTEVNLKSTQGLKQCRVWQTLSVSAAADVPSLGWVVPSAVLATLFFV